MRSLACVSLQQVWILDFGGLSGQKTTTITIYTTPHNKTPMASIATTRAALLGMSVKCMPSCLAVANLAIVSGEHDLYRATQRQKYQSR